MPFAPTTPVTGAAQTGLTTPTYTLTADLAPDVNGKQYAVTALGGTQTGVEVHAAAFPFTMTFTKPKSFKGLPANADANIPKNTYQLLIRKGVYCGVGNTRPSIALCRMYIEVPAGADVADPESIRAMLSLAFGTVTQIPSGIGDTAITGVV